MSSGTALFEEILSRLDRLAVAVSNVETALKQRTEFEERLMARLSAACVEPIAVNASDAARMLSIDRTEIYRLHHTKVLNGFRPYPRAHLKFLASELREFARESSLKRQDA